MNAAPSLAQKYVYMKKTNYDNAYDTNAKMVGGYPIMNVSTDTVGTGRTGRIGGGGMQLNSNQYNSSSVANNNATHSNNIGLENYALPAGLVLATSLISEYQSGGKHSQSNVSESDIIGDELFDKLIGSAAYSIVKPQINITRKNKKFQPK